MSDEKIDLLRSIVAIEMGIVPLNVSASEAVKNLSPEDARKTKRKFRKILRSLAKKKNMPHTDLTRADIHREIDRKARDLLV